MKNIRLFILSLLCLAGVSACMPEEYELGPVDVTADELVQGIAYSVTQDSADPNTIYLKNLMTGYTPLWEHPQGRSQKDEITLKIAFKGEYTIKFGVETAGGYVYGEPYVLNLTTDNLSYVDDPMWNTLTGGKGNSKTWKLDVAADGCKYFAGPLFFYGTDDWYGNVNGGQEASDYNGDGAVDSWNWAADWAGNGSWIFGSTGAMDYGTMTFDLIDGAHAKVTRLNADGSVESEQNGTFLLDTENYMLTMSDAGILHDPDRDAIVTQWGNARVLQLTEDFLQLGVIRDNDPNEGACLLVYNYVSQNYWDNPPAAEEPAKPSEPTLPEGWQDIVGTISQTAIEWKLSDRNPLDWCSMDGSRMNGWQAPDEYADWLGTPDPATYEGFSLTMDSADNSYKVVIPDGTEVEGTYTLDEKGVYTFDNGIPSFTVVGWASFATTAENQLRIMEIITKNGIISEMWVGAKDPAKEEYMGYHLVANVGAGGGTPSVPAGKVVAVNNDNLIVGDLENNGNIRLELYNEYGAGTKDAPVVLPSDLEVVDYLDIRVTLSGIELKEGAAGSYIAGVYYADADWNPQADTKNETDGTKITGDGTYTFHVPAAGASGAMVFVIDILNLSADLAEGAVVNATIDDIVIDGELPEVNNIAVNNDNLIIGDLEANGNIRLELYNEYGAGTKDAPVVDPSTFAVENELVIKVAISGIELKEGAVGSYVGGVYYADADWNPQADTKNETDGTTVTGDGIYTFRVPAAGASGIMVLVVDIIGLSTDLAEGSVVNAKIHSITVE